MRFLALISLFFLCACATQAQLMDQAEVEAWKKVSELASVQCGEKEMSLDEYDASYTPRNVLKREKCELKLLREVVQPHITTPIAYKELLADMKAIYRKYSSKKINFEEFEAEIELAAGVYQQKRQEHLTPLHNAEMQQWNNAADGFNQSMQINKPVHTYCTDIGNYQSCTSY